MRKGKIVIISVICSLIMGCMSTPKKKEKVVRLPFPDIHNWAPFYWRSQLLLVQGTVFEGLFGFAPDPEGIGGVKIVPVICESYEVSPDGKRWIFRLRKDKKWSNGDPVTAHDFVWSYRYYANPQMRDIPMWALPLRFIRNAWAVKSGAEPPENLGIKALDDWTLQIDLVAPVFDFHHYLATFGAVPIHRKSVEAHPKDWWRPGYLVCNGPYIVESWTQGKGAVLVRNPHYVGECGNVDKIILKFVTLGLHSYRAGELDFVFLGNPGEIKYVKSNPELRKHFDEEIWDLSCTAYQIARSFDPLFDNKKLRMAFAMAIDREILAEKVLVGRAVPAYKFWGDESSIGRKIRSFPYDPERARQILAEAGYPGGKGLPQLRFYMSGAAHPVVEYIVTQWEKNLGVKVLIENLEAGVFGSRYVWGLGHPEVKPGFTLIGCVMTQFTSPSLTKAVCGAFWFHMYPGKIRRLRWDLEVNKRREIRAANRGATQADWNELVLKKNKLLDTRRKILSIEPCAKWRELMLRPPTFEEQFDSIYNRLQNEPKKNDERIQLWRQAAEILLSTEIGQITYNNMCETHKAARRKYHIMMESPFEKAIRIAPKVVQMLQDEYYMVPLYFDRITYLKNPKLTGVMIYRFAWGPQVFNFKYLNLAD